MQEFFMVQYDKNYVERAIKKAWKMFEGRFHGTKLIDLRCKFFDPKRDENRQRPKMILKK